MEIPSYIVGQKDTKITLCSAHLFAVVLPIVIFCRADIELYGRVGRRAVQCLRFARIDPPQPVNSRTQVEVAAEEADARDFSSGLSEFVPIGDAA